MDYVSTKREDIVDKIRSKIEPMDNYAIEDNVKNNVKTGVGENVGNYFTLDGLKQFGRGLAFLSGMAIGSFLYSGCSDHKDNIVDPNCIPIVTPAGDTLYAIVERTRAGQLVSVDTTALDINRDITFSFGYDPNTIPGITDIRFKEITPDIGYTGPGITGMQKIWVVSDIVGTDGNRVEDLVSRIYGAKVISQVWLLKDDGSPGSIIYGIPDQAKHVKIELNVTESANAGLDSMFTHGVLRHSVNAYGQEGHLRFSREHTFPISNPSLMPWEATLPLNEDKITGITYLTQEEFMRLVDSLGLGKRF